MSKFQGSIIILISVLIGFSQIGAVVATALSKDINFLRLILSSAITVLCYFGIKRGVQLFKGGSSASTPPESPKGKLIYSLGNLMLILSAISVASTIGLIIYLNVTKSAGVPAGFGFAIALVLFAVGNGVKGIGQKIS